MSTVIVSYDYYSRIELRWLMITKDGKVNFMTKNNGQFTTVASKCDRSSVAASKIFLKGAGSYSCGVHDSKIL